MATELGQAYVQIMPSARGISGSIQKELDPESAIAGKSAGGKIASAIKGALVAAAIGKTVGAALTEGGKLQQSLGGVETLFKENADKVKQYANEAYKTAGLSANAYMENVTSFSASLLQSLGGDTDKAADKANTAMIDMSDNANKMGTSMEAIQNAYQGFAKQNYTMLDNLKLGYGGTKSEMERLLSDAQKLTGVEYDINNLADVYDAIHAVQGELGITGTTAKESAETLTGSLSSMKGAFSNVLGNLALGEDLKPSLKALAGTVSTFLFKNLIPMVTNILKALPGAIVTLVQEAVPYFLKAGKSFIAGLNTGVVKELPNLVESAGKLINKFVEFILSNLPKIISTGKDLLLSLVDGIVKNLPAIGASVIRVIGNFVGIVISNLPSIMGAGVSLLASLVAGIISRLPELIATAVKLIAEFVAMIISKLPDVVGAGVEILSGLMGVITGWKDKFFNAGKNIISAIADGIKSAIGKVKDAIGSVVQSIRDFLPFSPAKEGPLKDLGRLNFSIIADGISNAKKPIKDAMNELTQSAVSASLVPAGFDVRASGQQTVNHTGTIRVEGVSNRGELVGVVDIVMDQLRRDNRR